ncbi:MAG: hypothetical protein KIT84_20840 [Labilithrix sp.]|nr:hypothetical protein [Labilithrix sp.]MCW5813489.1 hypothetical protein [Labilithrix sp.]
MRFAPLMLVLAACIDDRPGESIKPPTSADAGGDAGPVDSGDAPPALPLLDRWDLRVAERKGVSEQQCANDAKAALDKMGGRYSAAAAANEPNTFFSKRDGAALYATCRPFDGGSLLVTGAWGIEFALDASVDGRRLESLGENETAVEVSTPNGMTYPELRSHDASITRASTAAKCLATAAEQLKGLFPAAQGGWFDGGVRIGAVGGRPGTTVSVTCVGAPNLIGVLVHVFTVDPGVDMKALVQPMIVELNAL